MRYAKNNLDLDPHWHTCKRCDMDGEFTPNADGLCPDCAAEVAKERQEAEDGE